MLQVRSPDILALEIVSPVSQQSKGLPHSGGVTWPMSSVTSPHRLSTLPSRYVAVSWHLPHKAGDLCFK